MLKQTEQILTSVPAITLPKDQYAHEGAPTEWWWHVGTLKTSDGRIFGFEVNACGVNLGNQYGFTEIAITDVKEQVHYQCVNDRKSLPEDWATYDVASPWSVKIEGPAGATENGQVTMLANPLNGSPLNMSIAASFTDGVTNKSCEIQLNLSQDGAPLLVWGTGCKEVYPQEPTPLTRNNYYYSLTNLQASGSIKIGEETFDVTGLTWMDHEYGTFPHSSSGHSLWTLQDMQLANGLHLSNYTQFNEIPKVNTPMKSNATLLIDGKSIFVETVTTPMDAILIRGHEYYMKFKVSVETEGFKNLYFIIESLCPDQLFHDPKKVHNGYEGVAKCEMFFQASEKTSYSISSGTAWIEQSLGYS